MIISVELEKEDDIELAEKNKLDLACPCGAYCLILMD
jgi:hypothetical protein